jgi:hypothetical protein
MRQVAVAVPILGLFNWAILQFALLPGMTEQQRRGIYSGWMSTPYPYAFSAALICAAVWFVFSYRGRYSTHGRRIAAFGMVVAALCGMLMIVLIRATWHI